MQRITNTVGTRAMRSAAFANALDVTRVALRARPKDLSRRLPTEKGHSFGKCGITRASGTLFVQRAIQALQSAVWRDFTATSSEESTRTCAFFVFCFCFWFWFFV